jgi:hypothetical protein
MNRLPILRVQRRRKSSGHAILGKGSQWTGRILIHDHAELFLHYFLLHLEHMETMT